MDYSLKASGYNEYSYNGMNTMELPFYKEQIKKIEVWDNGRFLAGLKLIPADMKTPPLMYGLEDGVKSTTFLTNSGLLTKVQVWGISVGASARMKGIRIHVGNEKYDFGQTDSEPLGLYEVPEGEDYFSIYDCCV